MRKKRPRQKGQLQRCSSTQKPRRLSLRRMCPTSTRPTRCAAQNGTLEPPTAIGPATPLPPQREGAASVSAAVPAGRPATVPPSASVASSVAEPRTNSAHSMAGEAMTTVIRRTYPKATTIRTTMALMAVIPLTMGGHIGRSLSPARRSGPSAASPPAATAAAARRPLRTVATHLIATAAAGPAQPSASTSLLTDRSTTPLLVLPTKAPTLMAIVRVAECNRRASTTAETFGDAKRLTTTTTATATPAAQRRWPQQRQRRGPRRCSAFRKTASLL